MFGIYGFDFCSPHVVGNLSLGVVNLEPKFGYPDCSTHGRSLDELRLTGIGRFVSEPSQAELADVIQRLADGVTFAQQQRVVATRPIALSRGDSVEAMIESKRLPEFLPILHRRNTAGGTICQDAFCREGVPAFLERFMAYVIAAPVEDPLFAALYRHIEIWRLSVQLVEIEHFLAFSGLEILGRAYGEERDNRNAAVPISRFLSKLGFEVPQALAERWCAARNACFHRGLLRSIAPGSGTAVDVAHDLDLLTPLLADAALKQLGFDHEHINWNRWRDRMPFQ
jgi:hypothetical protein